MRNQLSQMRAEQGLTQQRLADLLGVSRQTIISIENGKHDPSLALAFNMAAVFSCPVEELFLPDPWEPER